MRFWAVAPYDAEVINSSRPQIIVGRKLLGSRARRSAQGQRRSAQRSARREGERLSDEETDEPMIADHRNFYKVEQWSRDGQRIERMLFAGNSLDRAREIFKAEIRC